MHPCTCLLNMTKSVLLTNIENTFGIFKYIIHAALVG